MTESEVKLNGLLQSINPVAAKGVVISWLKREKLHNLSVVFCQIMTQTFYDIWRVKKKGHNIYTLD